MDVIQNETLENKHLAGLSADEVKFICNLAKLTASAIIKKANENSIPVHPDFGRRSK